MLVIDKGRATLTSFAKREANRKNANRSTGPKSKAGKSKSSQNAVKHGAYSTRHLILGEDQKLYAAIRSEQKSLFKPVSFIDTALVDELVNQLWTLRRLERAERYYLSELRSDLVTTPGGHPLQVLAKRISPITEGVQPEKSASDVQREFYGTAYVYDETGRIERISTQKRHALQTMLSIERELERRLRRRKKKKGEDLADEAE